jgi:hypothetical protein
MRAQAEEYVMANTSLEVRMDELEQEFAALRKRLDEISRSEPLVGTNRRDV